MSDETAPHETVRLHVRHELLEADDWEYLLAGHLVGTQWVLPEQGADQIGKIRQTAEREMGQKMKYPEVVFDFSGKRMSVRGFLRRIDPEDIGDINPSCRAAERIVRIQQQHSWRTTHTATGATNE